MESLFAPFRSAWWKGEAREPPKPHLIVSWNKDKLVVDFETEAELRTTPLGQLKIRLRDMTGVAVGAMKLVFSGAIMKDDGAPIGSFGMFNGAKIMLVGTKFEEKEVASATTSGNAEEYALIHRINVSFSKATTTLLPQVEQFEAEVGELGSPDQETQASGTKARLAETHTRLSEQLLQILIALDGIEAPSDFQEARKRRKECVKFTQGLIDRVDAVKERMQSR